MEMTIISDIRVKDGFSEEFMVLAKAQQEISIEEAGCLQYLVYQDWNDQNLFVFYETYRDPDAAVKHRDAPYSQAFLQTIEKMRVELNYKVLTPLKQNLWGLLVGYFTTVSDIFPSLHLLAHPPSYRKRYAL